MNPLQNLDSNVLPNKRKVSSVVVDQCKKSKLWRVRAMYHARTGARGQRKNTSFQYATQADARGAAPSWVEEWEKPRRRSVSPAQRESECCTIWVCLQQWLLLLLCTVVEKCGATSSANTHVCFCCRHVARRTAMPMSADNAV